MSTETKYTLVANLYGWPHDKHAPGGAHDVFDECR